MTVRSALALGLSTLGLTTIGVTAALPAAQAQSPADDLAQVRRHLQAVTSMTAAFTQTDRAGRVLSGRLTLKQPGRIRFQYAEGVPYLIVADGRALTFIDYSVRQVQRWPIGNSPLGILLDPSRDLSSVARVVPGDPRLVTVAASVPRHPEYGRITLVFAREPSSPAGLKLQGWAALDSQNNRTTIKLSDQRFNVPVPANAFQWNDPRRRSPRS